jgi:hypothetical protein
LVTPDNGLLHYVLVDDIRLTDCPSDCLQLACPTNVVVACQGTNGAQVTWSVSATNRCLPSDLTVTCTPPAGSFFPLGHTMVECCATDAAGRRRCCQFTVTVRPSLLSIERAILVRWSCGVLQCSPNVDGPWTDLPVATSPYCVPSSLPQKFYRVRD